ncbi:hypothetical protein FRZ67_14370 [Panacibacter ginsenosidivorans]|uniref:Tetratricopeptide repeat protein n=1 Tax=Panacibacter ginsenosidivorans TaxID=1813871 RepID=A0A5B8VBX2_9BACT|nr:hypothetical protein [Panacibacter ginsenosidivorans]QEC68431.1 hypothetical protein FRZ67_14370 [Panacibacter ginsenosidivorans]
MQDNYTYDEMELLIRYMDGEADAEEKAATEKMLQENTSLQERYENLLTAKGAIRSQGLKEKVQALHQQYFSETQIAKTEPAKIIKPAFGIKTFMRIAAVLILVIAGYGVYQFTSTSNDSLYKANFETYQLPVMRGETTTNSIDSLYNANNFTAVIATASSKPVKTQKDYFLTAQSYLQTNNASAAINAFKNVEQLNNTSAEKYFVQETDYYLALAYIKANDIYAAEKQLSKITANKQHMFYSKAKEISSTKLMILKWKE